MENGLRKAVQRMIDRLRNYNSWRLITKISVITNMWAYWALMMWAPSSLTYIISQSYGAGIIPTVVMIVGIFLLSLDLFLTDHKYEGRRHWAGNDFIPKVYMMCGAGYLIFAYLASLVSGGWVLVLNAVVQALMCGWVAFLEQTRQGNK